MKYENYTDFGIALTNFMDEKGIKQTKLAESIGMAQSQISNYLQGKRPIIPETAQALADALEVPKSKQAEFFLLAYGFTKETIQPLLKVVEVQEEQPKPNLREKIMRYDEDDTFNWDDFIKGR